MRNVAARELGVMQHAHAVWWFSHTVKMCRAQMEFTARRNSAHCVAAAHSTCSLVRGASTNTCVSTMRKPKRTLRRIHAAFTHSRARGAMQIRAQCARGRRTQNDRDDKEGQVLNPTMLQLFGYAWAHADGGRRHAHGELQLEGARLVRQLHIATHVHARAVRDECMQH